MIKTEVVTVSAKERDFVDKINKAADIIKSGGLVVFPTETVYGSKVGGVLSQVDGSLA